LPQQFDLVENLNPVARVQYPYLIVLQHDRISSVSGVVTAPLVRTSPTFERTRLHPTVNVAGQTYAIFVEDLAAVPSRVLGRVVGTAEANATRLLLRLTYFLPAFERQLHSAILSYHA
jgi:CcdB protein